MDCGHARMGSLCYFTIYIYKRCHFIRWQFFRNIFATLKAFLIYHSVHFNRHFKSYTKYKQAGYFVKCQPWTNRGCSSTFNRPPTIKVCFRNNLTSFIVEKTFRNLFVNNAFIDWLYVERLVVPIPLTFFFFLNLWKFPRYLCSWSKCYF